MPFKKTMWHFHKPPPNKAWVRPDKSHRTCVRRRCRLLTGSSSGKGQAATRSDQGATF